MHNGPVERANRAFVYLRVTLKNRRVEKRRPNHMKKCNERDDRSDCTDDQVDQEKSQAGIVFVDRQHYLEEVADISRR